MQKGTITVLGHQVEYTSENIVLDEGAEETLYDWIADQIEAGEKSGEPKMELEDENEKPIIVYATWKIVNEADKWREIAGKLYNELKWCKSVLAPDADINNVLKEYQQLIEEENAKDKE